MGHAFTKNYLLFNWVSELHLANLTWLNLKNIMLSKLSQTQKNRS